MRAAAYCSLLLMLLLAQSVTAQGQTATPIEPTPGHETSGHTLVEVTPDGDLVLEVSVQGPQHEISRTVDGRLWPNLIWHIVEGTCDAWMQETSERGKVLHRFIEAPAQPDSLSFRRTVPHAFVGHLAGRPLALVAFRNGGGGPFYACGNLPANQGSPASPTTPHPRAVPVQPDLLAVAALVLLLGSGLVAWRLAHRGARHQMPRFRRAARGRA